MFDISRWQDVHKRLHAASIAAGRDPASVRLLAVSKTRRAGEIEALLTLGQRHFGENYVQEALGKISSLDGRGLVWHFIGPLQSNKAREVARHFDWLHSCDRISLVKSLSRHRPPERAPLQVLIQVNLDDEQQKAGCVPSELPALARAVNEAPGLDFCGLMAIPAPRSEISAQRAVFARLRALAEDLRREGLRCAELSMGMSEDLEAAVLEGASWVRIGSALFGPRDPRPA